MGTRAGPPRIRPAASRRVAELIRATRVTVDEFGCRIRSLTR